MSDETRTPEQHDEEPQVFAVNKETGGKWTFSRRGFVKAAGVTAAASALIGKEARIARAEPDRQAASGARAHNDLVFSVAISSDGTLLASGSFDNTVKLWSLPEGALLRTLDTSSYVWGVAFSPDGTRLASLSSASIMYWSLSSGEQLRSLEGSIGALSMAFSPDGTLLASGNADQTIKLWTLPAKALLRTLEGHTDGVQSVAISPDGMLLASGSSDNTIKLWSLPDGALLRTLEGHTDFVDSLAFSPDGTLLASGGADNTIKLWSLPAPEVMRSMEAVTVVEVVSGVRIRSKPGTAAGDASVIRTASVGETFDIRSSVEETAADGYTWIPIIADGQDAWIAKEGFVALVEQASGGVRLLHTLDGYSGSAAISPDGTLLASGSGHSINLWTLPEGTLFHTWVGHTGDVSSVAFSPDGRLLASGGLDNTVKLWTLPEGEHLMDLIDIAASTASFEGLQYSPGDTGEGVITLPCGSPIPAGATCICNCVQGESCSCVGHRSGGSGGGGHYWFPN